MPCRTVFLHWAILPVVMLCFGSSLWAGPIPPKPVPSKIKWLYAYQEGKKEAQRSQKPLFVLFRCER